MMHKDNSNECRLEYFAGVFYPEAVDCPRLVNIAKSDKLDNKKLA